jgi:hypothetical protein
MVKFLYSTARIRSGRWSGPSNAPVRVICDITPPTTIRAPRFRCGSSAGTAGMHVIIFHAESDSRAADALALLRMSAPAPGAPRSVGLP